ncbi:hypothetical protein SCLCIDRAFT_630561 [Scleroderma citrinum Foug A]|uniref:Uncharacterized protein n=1 Tax=Scleroderma citrinum Foug A TaxID=1036808 RepID=A0A0C3DUW3_9AGAM|nr:hypothetical protein SCLCIDRAFT_630561 [Scleroderma citrinum Foug A]
MGSGIGNVGSSGGLGYFNTPWKPSYFGLVARCPLPIRPSPSEFSAVTSHLKRNDTYMHVCYTTRLDAVSAWSKSVHIKFMYKQSGTMQLN